LTIKPYSFEYRPEIDGLRALAVIAVIIFHFDKSALPGGFLGVDVFFVISGYVITSSLLKHKDQQSFWTFIVGFYARRMRRLLPALIICLSITAIAAWVLMPLQAVHYQTARAAILGFSNIVLYHDVVDYFVPATSFNPFTQTWSLGVEEQFYLLFPALLWFFRPQGGHALKNKFVLVLLFLTVITQILFVAIGEVISNKAAFYLMPLRFWELATGSILFISGQSQRDHLRKMLFLGLQIALFGAIVLLFFVPEQYSAYSTVFCVVATLLLIETLNVPTHFKSFMQSRPIAFVGLISYSLYLWHWPILSLSLWTIGINSWTIGFQVLAVVATALLSYFLIERPFRSGFSKFWNGGTIVVGLMLIGVTFVGINALENTESILALKPDHFANSVAAPPDFTPVPVNDLPYNPTCVVDDQTRKMLPDTFENCTAKPVGSATQTIWVLGDSHAGHLQGMLRGLHEATGLGVHVIETPGKQFPLLKGMSSASREQIFNQILENIKPRDIIVVARLFMLRNKKWPPAVTSDVDEWIDGVRGLSNNMAKRNVSVLAFGPVPMFNFDTRRNCFWKIMGHDDCTFERAPQFKVVNSVLEKLAAASTKSENLKIFDPFSVLCPATEKTCNAFSGEALLYRDADHINALGSQNLAKPFFDFLQANKLLL
jgi:peptidoglycan/LPS O-acetylase OafA/YrhL